MSKILKCISLLIVFVTSNLSSNSSYAVKQAWLVMEPTDNKTLRQPQKLHYNGDSYNPDCYDSKWETRKFTSRVRFDIQDQKKSLLNAIFSVKFANGAELMGNCPFEVGEEQSVEIRIINGMMLGFSKYDD